MRIFRQAFSQLGGSRSRVKSDERRHDDVFVTPPEEYFKQPIQQQIERHPPLGRQFFTQLSHLEIKLHEECSLDRVQQIVVMYQKCIEFYDSKKDDIKYYFVEKIQNALYDMQKLQKLKTTIDEIKPTRVELSPQQLRVDDEKYIRNKKKEKSIKLSIQQQINQEVQLNTNFVGDMVQQYHDTVDQQCSIIQEQVNQQIDQFQERLRKRSMSRTKSLSRCCSDGGEWQ